MALVLTPNQEKTYNQLEVLAKNFTTIIIQGERETGKHTIVEKFLTEQKQAKVITIDLCALSIQEGNPLQPSNFYHHLINQCKNITEPMWIYIRHWDKIKEVMEDYGIDHRYFPRYALARFSEELNIGHRQLIVTTENDFRLESSTYWLIKHEIKIEDIRTLLERYFDPGEVEQLMPLTKKIKPGHLNQILAYTRSFSDEDRIARFKEGIIRIYGSSLDPEETVIETIPNMNLIGMESILASIETSIITPMEFGSEYVPLKKGIVLAGPPGTGKTSIGRWLAYRLRGRIYPVDGSSGVTGNSLINTVTDTIEKAYRNAPSVVFIDDVDMLFDYPDTYRSFLTLLDGLENKHRGGVCVIVTCMDIAKIPSSLIRGGRLELCLETHLPDFETRKQILNLGFDKMMQLLTRLEEEKKINNVTKILTRETNTKFILNLASQMGNWNCADIQRYLDDVLRIILSSKGKEYKPLREMTREVIEDIRHQYQRIRRPEERPDISSMYG